MNGFGNRPVTPRSNRERGSHDVAPTIDQESASPPEPSAHRPKRRRPYKDIDKVMKRQTDLVEIVAQLKPVLCVKG